MAKPNKTHLRKKFNEVDPSFILTARAGNCLSIGGDLEARHLYLLGPVDEGMAARFIISLNLLNSTEGPIRVTVNSPGGSVSDGLAIYDAMKLSRNPIIVEGTGQVSSIASIFFQAGSARYITAECRMMIHDGSLEVHGGMHASVAISVGKEMQAGLKKMYEILAERTGADVATIKKLCVRETYFSAREAVGFGLADEILTKDNYAQIVPRNYGRTDGGNWGIAVPAPTVSASSAPEPDTSKAQKPKKTQKPKKVKK